MGCSNGGKTKENESEQVNKVSDDNCSKNNKYKVIFCLGNPGCGKNTQCDLIKEKYKFSHFSCGDLLRAEASTEGSENGNLINELIREGKIVPAKITCSLAKREMNSRGKENIYLIDGFPRNKENLDGWLEVFGEECIILAVIHLDCSDETCSKRIKLRALNSGRIDDNEDSLKKRFKVFEDETLPNIERLSDITKVLKIDSDKNDKDEIFKNLCSEIDSNIAQHL